MGWGCGHLWGHFVPNEGSTNWKKPDARDHAFYDSIYTKYPEKTNVERQKAD